MAVTLPTILVNIPRFTIVKDKETTALFEVEIFKGPTKWALKRNFNEFKWLDAKLKEKKVKKLPALPGEKMFGKNNPKFLDERRIALKKYLQKVLEVADLLQVVPLRTWLEIDPNGRHTPPPKRSGINVRAVAVVKALYDYEARDDYELQFKAGDTISVIEKLDETWWKGKMMTLVGVFPVSFVELVADMSAPRKVTEDELLGSGNRRASTLSTGGGGLAGASAGSRASAPPSKATICTAKALYEFTATGAGQLSLRVGDTVNVTDQSNAQWWEGNNANGSGYFPFNYVEVVPTAPVAPPPAMNFPPPPAMDFGGGGYGASSGGYGGGGGGYGASGGYDEYNEEAASSFTEGASYYDSTYDEPAAAADSGGRKVTALYDYAARSNEELTLQAGLQYDMWSDQGDGWYYGGDSYGRNGVFPASYVQ